MSKGRHAAPRRSNRSRITMLAVATPVVLLGASALPANAASVPSCYGYAATMVVTEQSPETVEGTEFRDVIVVTGGSHEIWAGAGRDLVCGSGQRDVIHGGDGNDRLHGGGGRDRLYGDDGHDMLAGNRGSDRLHGGDGNDRLYGQGGQNLLDGAAGDDALHANLADSLRGEEDDETYAPPA